MSEEGLRVLLVDDERFLREPLARRLKEEYGYQVDPAATEAEAWQLVTTAGQPYDVALIDDLLTPAPDREPEPRGVELVERIRQRCPETECIIFTGWGMERELPALRAGAYRYLAKPFRYDELAMLIRSAAHQVRLRAIGRAILSERDLDQVLEQINGAARSLALADEAAIVLLEPGSGRLRIHATTHATGSQWREHFQGQSLSREIIRTGQVVRISDTAQDRRVSRQVVDTGIRSFVGLPIPGEGGNLGVLYVYSHRPGRFDEWGTVAVLQTLAGQAGLAIANAQAFQQLQVHARYMEALVRAGEGLTRATRLEEQLALAWDFVREQLKVSTFFVALYNRETDILRFPLYYDEGKPVMRPDRHIGDDREQWGLAGYVVKTGQELYWPTDEDKQRDCCGLGIKPKEVGKPCQSCFFLPLKIGGQVVGVISIQSYTPHAFSPILLDAVRTLGSQLSVALENARRVLELEQMRQAAEAMSRVFEPRQALQQIVDSAAQVLGADSAALWSYDEVRDLFIPEELVAVGIPPEELDKFREEEPKPGRTADTVMQRGYVAVTEISRPEYDFLGQPTRDLLNRIGVRSFQGIALRVGDERLGVLYANYRRLRSFGQEEERKLRTFASHAALTLKNARLLAQMQRTREAAGAIAGVTLQEKLDQTLKTIARHTQQVLGSDVVTLYSYDEATGRFGEWATEIRDPRRPDSARPPEKLKPDSVVWSILNLAESPYYYPAEDHAAGDRLLGGRFVCVEEIRAALGIQLRVGGRKVGVMFVDFRSPHHFTADEIATIQLFADQAAVAIRNARQYDEIVRDARLRQGLLQAGRQIMALQEPKVVLQNVVHIMREVVACDVVTLYTYDQDRGEIGFPAYVAGRLRDRQSLDELGYVSKDSVVGKLLASGQPHFADHAPDDPVMSAGGFVAREGIQSSAGIPLKFGERVLGVMFVNYRAFHPFPAQEQEALLLFASQAAMAIQNARQYGELRRTKGLVGARTALAWMGMTSSAWRHAIDKHALTIREQVELLRRDRERTTARLRGTRMEERLSTIERLANQILEKPIIPPLSREEGLELVALNDLVGERARQLWQNDPYRKAQLRLDLQLPASATVQASPDWLRRALDILVDNAVEAVAGREVQEVTIGTRVANGGAEISVTDTGPGIPEEIRARIGLEPIERPEDAKGLGMGLLMAQTIVQTYGGELRVAATGPTGTTMVLWLPLTPQGKTEEITHAD